MAVSINMKQFGAPDGPNIFENGDIQRVVQYVDQQGRSIQEKVTLLMDCLTQALSSEGTYVAQCGSVLKRELFTYATQFHTETLQSIENSRYKYNLQLEDVIKRMRLLASSILPLNLLDFSGAYHNILETGDSHLVLDQLDYINLPAHPVRRIETKVQALLDLLAQAAEIGGRYASKCESDFKVKLYTLAQAHPVEVQNFIQTHSNLKQDSKFKDVIRIMENLANHQVDISHFSNGTSPELDVLKTGKVELIIAYIHSLPNVQIRLEVLLSCLSQTVSVGGPFQGLCESQLQHALYGHALNFRDATQIVLGLSHIKYDPNLLKILQNLHQLVGNIPGINMYAFFHETGFIDIVDTGRMRLVLSYIDQHAPNNRVKFQMLLNCLSQTLQGKGRCLGECERVLKVKLFELTKEDPDAASTVLDNDKFKEDTKIHEVVKKIEYLSDGILNHRGKFARYVRRVGHHLYESYNSNRFFGAIYAGGAFTLILAGGFQTTFSNTLDEEQRHAGYAMLGAGGSLIGWPILNALYSATQDER
ncbi:MAG TPA: hypothetical protein VHA52_07775 [Candidatus Babeliaceae bacterium]|nr:hypothetical protein [Candidatus Babeliaceae bacterium]